MFCNKMNMELDENGIIILRVLTFHFGDLCVNHFNTFDVTS